MELQRLFFSHIADCSLSTCKDVVDEAPEGALKGRRVREGQDFGGTERFVCQAMSKVTFRPRSLYQTGRSPMAKISRPFVLL